MRFYGFPEDPGPDYDVLNFDFDRDPARMIETYVDFEACGTDLSKFQEGGGKLLVYQGLADADIVPEATRQWYDALATDMGGAGATADFARLFLVPGMSHCGIPPTGPGVAHPGFDPLPALERWVEQGVPPESIVMTKTDEAGRTEWTRPVCVYPEVAKYQGTGDIQDAASWACRAP